MGVDTPETKYPKKPVQYFGEEATAFIRKMVEGKRVRLEFEQANSPFSHKDKYGRTLAYVILSLIHGPWNPNALFSHVVSNSARMVPVVSV